MDHKPFTTNYPRWKNIQTGYIVTIENIVNHQGKNGYYSQVFVKGSAKSRETKRMWPADLFKKLFEPTGRKKVPQDTLTRIMKSKDVL